MRVILERGKKFDEVLTKQLVVNVPSFSREDEMPVVGRKYHMASHGVFRVVNPARRGLPAAARRRCCVIESEASTSPR
jgi:hypothetical protein